MFTSTPVGIDEISVASAAAYLTLEMKAPSDEASTPAPDRDKSEDSEDLDGCDVEIAEATSDEDLPASEGGVA